MKTSYRYAKAVVRPLTNLALFAVLGGSALLAQDPSGDGLLNAAYRFRYVAAANYNNSGNLSEVFAAYGVITFSGNGVYAISPASQVIDNTVSGGKPTTICANSTSGTYEINAAGLGYITNPFTGGVILGEFTNGVFIGSSTESNGQGESGTNDLFIAILAGTPPTNSTFTAPYWIGGVDFTLGTDVDVKNPMFEITPNGSGGLGNLTIQGQANNQPGTWLTQTVSGATYNFASDGNAQLNIPVASGLTTSSPTLLLSGTRSLYVSANGNFVLGWNPSGYDILFGVKALSGPFSDSLYKGLYYTAGFDDIPQQCGVSSFWGSTNADGMQDEVEHQRLLSSVCSYTGGVADYGTDNYTAMASDGSIDDDVGFGCVTSYTGSCPAIYQFGAGGSAFIAISNSESVYGLNIGIQAPSFTPSGIFLSPIGVVNAASWDPVTASVAPGELITLFGSNMAPATLLSTGGLPFPTELGNVQVEINGTPAPICYVSPTQISVIAPFELANVAAEGGYTASIQINNGGLLSNQISVYLLTDANSGIFSEAQNGIGDAIAEHANGSYVTESNPAQPGETIVLALAGMGAVSPTVQDGAVGPSSPLSETENFTTANELLVLFNDYTNNSLENEATVQFAGLYPGLAGLYQMNVTVPTNVGPGDVYVEVVTDSADVEQVTVPVGGTTSAAALSSAAKVTHTLVPAPKFPRNASAGPHVRPTKSLPKLRKPAVQ